MKFTQIILIIGIIGPWLGHSMGSQENGTAGLLQLGKVFSGANHGEFTSNLSGYNLNFSMVIFLSTK